MDNNQGSALVEVPSKSVGELIRSSLMDGAEILTEAGWDMIGVVERVKFWVRVASC